MTNRDRTERREEKLVSLVAWIGLFLSIVLALGLVAMWRGWIDSAPQAAAMLFVIVAFGLFVVWAALHLALLVGALILGRRNGARSMRWVYGSLGVAALILGAGVVLLTTG